MPAFFKYTASSTEHQSPIVSEICIANKVYQLEADYEISEPGYSFARAESEVFCIRTGIDSSYAELSLAECLIIYCVDKENNLFERIGRVASTKDKVYGDWFGGNGPMTTINLA
jgi:hypothetical protein